MRVIFLIPVLATLSGCAFSEDTVDVPYAPTQAAPVASAVPLSLTLTDGRIANRARISVKINGYGMDAAPIRAARPVTEIVHDALAQEFRERGFRLDGTSRTVNVTVEKFYNSFGIGLLSGTATGDVQLNVSVAYGSRTSFQRTYKGRSSASILLANGSNAALSVSEALQDAIGQMFADQAFVTALTAQASPDGTT